MSRFFLPIAALLTLLLFSCANKQPAPAADRPHATVLLRDGTTMSGTVVESTSTGIKLEGDDGVTHTIATSQVKTIEYGEPAAPAAAAPGSSEPAPERARRVPQSAPAPSRESRPHPTEAAVTTKTHEVPVGTEISVRTAETIDSGKAVEGQTFAADVTNNVTDAAGNVVIPRGANAKIIIRSASKGGRIRGASDLTLDLAAVAIDGRLYELSTTDLQRRGREGLGANKRTGEFAGGGAAVGAIIGAIAGGGKGAAIGAGSGAAAGAAAQVLTRGGAIKVPAETVLTFKLDQALRVVSAR